MKKRTAKLIRTLARRPEMYHSEAALKRMFHMGDARQRARFRASLERVSSRLFNPKMDLRAGDLPPLARGEWVARTSGGRATWCAMVRKHPRKRTRADRRALARRQQAVASTPRSRIRTLLGSEP